jgi:protein TonB
MQLWLKRALSFGSMLCGTTLVFGTVVLMNAYEEPPKEPPKTAEVDFKVEKRPPPKQKRPKPKPKAQRQRSTASAPTPSPNLSSAISAPGLVLPGFDMGDLGENLSEKLLGDTDKKMSVMAGAGCDEKPRPVRTGKMEFPENARARGISGGVKLSVKVGTGGQVLKVKILESRPMGVFDEVAKRALEQWEFSPCIFEGEAVETWVTQPLDFNLQKKT